MHSLGLRRMSITIKNLSVLCFKWEGKCLPYLDEITQNNFSILGSIKVVGKNLFSNFIFGSDVCFSTEFVTSKRNKECCFLNRRYYNKIECILIVNMG